MGEVKPGPSIVPLPMKPETLAEMFKHAELDGWTLVHKHKHTTDSSEVCVLILVRDKTL